MAIVRFFRRPIPVRNVFPYVSGVICRTEPVGIAPKSRFGHAATAVADATHGDVDGGAVVSIAIRVFMVGSNLCLP